MNRKTKTIIFWIVAGIFIAGFLVCLFFGGVNSIFGAGTEVYNSVGKFISTLGLNKSDVFAWSPFICIACGCILAFMFYRRYNTRIN